MNQSRKEKQLTNFMAQVNCQEEREEKLMKELFNVIHKSRNIVIMQNYFTNDECDEMKAMHTTKNRKKRKWEPINFDRVDKDEVAQRFQKSILNAKNVKSKRSFSTLPKCLSRVLEIILKAHPESSSFYVKTLKSIDMCERQTLHCDDNEFQERSKMWPTAFITLNLFIAIEQNTKLHVMRSKMENETLRDVEKGSLVIMSGNCFHAGASFDDLRLKEHYRVHVSIGNRIFKNEGEEVTVVIE